MKSLKLAIILFVGLMAAPQTTNAQFFKKALKALDKYASSTWQRSSNTQRSTTKSNYSTSSRSKSSSNAVSQQKLVPSSNDEVVLTVSADGTTKEEATKVALRSAIEQAYGTFVSANTTILNDELVKDEIVTVTSGNIKEYKEIASERTPDGKTFVTLQATVCISKLVSYAQSKGASTEFAGATFAMNMKMKELNKKNEQKAFKNLAIQVGEMFPLAYDYKLVIGKPRVEGNHYRMKFMVAVVPNENMQNIINMVSKTIKALELTYEEKIEYDKIGLDVYHEVRRNVHGVSTVGDPRRGVTVSSTVNLRADESLPYMYMNYMILKDLCNFELVDNTGCISYVSGWWAERNNFYGYNGVNLLSEWGYYDYQLEKQIINLSDGSICNDEVFLFDKPTIIAEIPVYIPQTDIGKYSNFEIRKRTQPMKINIPDFIKQFNAL